MTRFFLWLTTCIGRLPLPWVRFVGAGLGLLLYGLIASRRRVVLINLRWCFPHWSEAQVRACARKTFICFAQTLLDRGWLWHGSAAKTLRRVRLTGAVDALSGNDPTLIFVPHFMGMDAGWVALTQQLPRNFTTIYAAQTNAVVDAWILQGRKRFGRGRPFDRKQGFKPVLAALRAGEPLCLLPDMNYEPKESVFVPFYGIAAATMPSLSRVAKLGRAKVLAMVCRITDWGYEIEISPVWESFPSADALADTARMNAYLESYINQAPEQYYWVHKRFKDRPPGEVAPY